MAKETDDADDDSISENKGGIRGLYIILQTG